MFLGFIRDNHKVTLMQNKRFLRYIAATLLGVFVFGVPFLAPRVFAETSSSSKNYQMVEGQFGVGSSDESCSGQYCSKTTIGELGATSSETTATFGTAEYNEPILQMIVSSGDSNLGVLTTEKTATKTMIVQIRNYLSGGYTLQIIGDAPKFDGHELLTPTTPTAATPGVEQFGMNVVENTSPLVGKKALQVPADKGDFGEAAPGYNETNKFKYSSGDTVARSIKNSGGTDYTISMIVNISSSTPSGHYSGDFSAVLIPSY